MENKKGQDALVVTPIKTYIKWNHQDKAKSKKLAISLFGSVMAFKHYSASAEGKLDSSVKADVSVYLQQLAYDESLLVDVCDIMLTRLVKINRGEKYDSAPIIIHNGKAMGYKGATQLVSFDVYTKEEDGNLKTITAIQLKTREKAEDKEWNKKATLYLSDTLSDGFYVADKAQALTLKENYVFFASLKRSLEGFANRSAIKRDTHWTKVLGGGDAQQTKTGGSENKSSSIKSYDEDDDMPF